MVVVDAGRGGNERLVVDDAVGEFAADDIGVGREFLEGRRGDVDVVRDAGVVVAT